MVLVIRSRNVDRTAAHSNSMPKHMHSADMEHCSATTSTAVAGLRKNAAVASLLVAVRNALLVSDHMVVVPSGCFAVAENNEVGCMIVEVKDNDMVDMEVIVV